MFKHLRTKLTVLYVALFLSALGIISLAVYVATTRNVENTVRDQLASSGTVFDNLSTTRYSRLEDEAQILAHDFGFRGAVATGDGPTIRSALGNLATRSGIDLAFLVAVDGRVTAQNPNLDASLPKDVAAAIQSDQPVSGLFSVNGVAYETVAAPISTPSPAGWVVFAAALGPAAMTNLTQLSAIPLSAQLMASTGRGDWVAIGQKTPAKPDKTLDRLIAGSLSAKNAGPLKLNEASGQAIMLIRRLPALGQTRQILLVLRCPLAAAFKPYAPLLITICAVSFTGVALLILGSWFLARSLTRPISELEEIARRLQRGEKARASPKTNDEIAALGLTFNLMADEIEARETTLKQARDVAEAANLAKSTFLANMNHEVRTPLNGVLGVAGLLAQTELDRHQTELVDIIERSGETLQRILNDVLDVVELGSGKLAIIHDRFDLGDLMRVLAASAAEAASAKGLAFSFEGDASMDVQVVGDKRRLEQILFNLLSNAVKFTDQGEVGLCIRSASAGETFAFEVWDTGVGFSPERAEDLFQPFSQADGTTTRRAGGTGIGLSLARDLARAMGGEIGCSGAPGVGASFVLEVPLQLTGMQGDRPPVDAVIASQASAGRLRVLLADDHPTNRKVIGLILQALEVELISVENGAEAVDAFKMEPFDLVLMDIQMPVMDGLTAISLMRSFEAAHRRPRTPILVISANVQSEHRLASSQSGADGHLAKPILAPVLLQAMQNVLDGGGLEPEGATDQSKSRQNA